MNDLISIIVPVYNIAPYLARCVESILSQTYTNIEIILVDDGSTDESPLVCKRLAKSDERIKVINKDNGGVTSARLAGVEAAKGEWIGFVDGDDEIESDMYQRLVDNAIKYRADISHCGHVVIRSNGTKQYLYNTGRLVKQDSMEATKELITGKFEPGLWNKLYNIRLLRKLLADNKINAKIKINEDLLMNFYLFREAEKIIYEDFCPYHYIKREDSASQTRQLYHIYDPIKVKNTIFCECLLTDLEGVARAARLDTCLNEYHGLINEKRPELAAEKPKILKKICEYSHDTIYLPKSRARYVKLLLKCPPLYDFIRRIYTCLKKNH